MCNAVSPPPMKLPITKKNSSLTSSPRSWPWPWLHWCWWFSSPTWPPKGSPRTSCCDCRPNRRRWRPSRYAGRTHGPSRCPSARLTGRVTCLQALFENEEPSGDKSVTAVPQSPKECEIPSLPDCVPLEVISECVINWLLTT